MMAAMNHQVKYLLIVALCLWQFPVPSRGQQAAPSKDLYYIIIDRAGTVGGTDLGDPAVVRPIREAIEGLVTKLPLDTQVTLQFFNSVAGAARTWPSMDDKSKDELLEYLRKEFKPNDETYLYGTVGEALSRIKSNLAQFRAIRVYVLSDGANNIKSKDYPNWAAVERVACDLKRAHPDFSVCWYTLGFKPKQKDKPTDDGCVCVVYVRDLSEGFKILRSPPSADFDASPGSPKVGDSVFFVLRNAANAEKAIWNFGDGAVVTNVNSPTNFRLQHGYKQNGTFTVTVTVTGPGGEASSQAAVRVMQDPPLVSKFKWSPQVGRTGESLQLIDESEGGPESFFWSIGTGNTISNRNPEVRPLEPGKLTVVLTVRRGEKTVSTTNEIPVWSSLPVPDFKISTNTTVLGQTVTFTAITNETDWVHHWIVAGDINLDGPTIQWKVDRKGRVEVIHQVKNDGGLVEKSDSLYVNEPPPPLVPRFHWTPPEVHADDKVEFVDESDGSPKKWQWQIPGRGTLETRTPSASFATVGTYSIVLTVQRDDQQATTNRVLTVLPKLVSVTAAFNTSTNLLNEGQLVTFRAITNASNWVHHWVIGGDTIVEGPVVQWKADRLGSVKIVHQVQNNGGLVEASDSLYVNKPLPPLVPRFHWAPAEVHAGEKVEFVDESEGAPKKWLWQIPSRGTVADRNPSATFANEGTYSIAFTIERDGQQASTSKILTVQPKVISVTAAFTVSSTNGILPLRIQFTDKSKGATEWQWDFGDGQRDDVQNPTHEYQQAGSYTPRLTIRNPQHEEARDSGGVTISTHLPPPPPPWWRIPAIIAAILLAVAWILWKRVKLLPLYGTLRWNHRGISGKKSLTDCGKSLDLSELGIEALKDKKGAHIIQNRKRDGMHVKSAADEPILLGDKKKFKLEGVEFEYQDT